MIRDFVTKYLHTHTHLPNVQLLSSLSCGIYERDCSEAFSDSIHPWSKAHCYWKDGS